MLESHKIVLDYLRGIQGPETAAKISRKTQLSVQEVKRIIKELDDSVVETRNMGFVGLGHPTFIAKKEY